MSAPSSSNSANRKRAHSSSGTDHEKERASKKARTDETAPNTAAASDLDVLHGAPEDDKDEKALKLDPILNPDVNIDPETGLRVFLGPAIKVRDAGPKALESAGELSWTCVTNTGARDDLKTLVALKDVVARQLPNMPKDYITRLVLDLNHRSVVGRKNGKVIGGITFKCFARPNMVKFIEIVFCAITADQQVQGYGSRLMSHMKRWAQANDYLHMLTYADDFAIGYFQRQGFTLELELDRKHWDIGFLKHYDSATLMHCALDPKIDYLEISAHLHTQRSLFIAKIRELTRQHLIFPGVDVFKRSASVSTSALPVRLNLEELPGLKEVGWDATAYRALCSKETQARVHAQNLELLLAMKRDENSWPFAAPVSELFPSEAPKYLQQVRDPIDLRTIEERLHRHFYLTHEMFVADMLRMVENCLEYNPKDGDYYALAAGLRDKYLRKEVTEVDVPASPPTK